MVDKPPCLMSDRRGCPGAHSERQPSQIIGIHWPLSRPHLSSCLQGPRAPRPLQGSPPPPPPQPQVVAPHPSQRVAPEAGCTLPGTSPPPEAAPHPLQAFPWAGSCHKDTHLQSTLSPKYQLVRIRPCDSLSALRPDGVELGNWASGLSLHPTMEGAGHTTPSQHNVLAHHPSLWAKGTRTKLRCTWPSVPKWQQISQLTGLSPQHPVLPLCHTKTAGSCCRGWEPLRKEQGGLPWQSSG